MTDFKHRFAEYNAATGEFAFSNVRNGLIVGLVSFCTGQRACTFISISTAIYKGKKEKKVGQD